MGVSTLVAQMHDTLSTIHTTIASLNTSQHDVKLDELERKRESTIQTLVAAFTAESQSLAQKREDEREAIAERRRREDEERERKRRLEDEELAAMEREQDKERDARLRNETQDVEEETDNLMSEVEAEAQRVIEEGKKRLAELEEKRKELNRLIDEQLKMPLPIVSTRVRRARSSFAVPAVAAESKPSEPVQARELVSNPAVKAPEAPEAPRVDVPVQAVRGFSPEPSALDPSATEPLDVTPEPKVLRGEATNQGAEAITDQPQDKDNAQDPQDNRSGTPEQAEAPSGDFVDNILKEELEVTERIAPRDEASLDSSGEDLELEDDIGSVSSVAHEEAHKVAVQEADTGVESQKDVASDHSALEAAVYQSIITAPLALDRSVLAYQPTVHQPPMEIPQVVIDEPVTIPPAKESSEGILDAYHQDEGKVHEDAVLISRSEEESDRGSVPTPERTDEVDDNLAAYPAPLSVVQTPKSPRSPAASPSNIGERGLDSDDEISDVEETYNARDVHRSISELTSKEPGVTPGATKALQVFDNLVKLVETLEKSQPQREDADDGDDGERFLEQQIDDLKQEDSDHASWVPNASVHDTLSSVNITHVKQDDTRELESEEIVPAQTKPDINTQQAQSPSESDPEDVTRTREEDSSKPEHEDTVMAQTTSDIKSHEHQSQYASDSDDLNHREEDDTRELEHDEGMVAQTASDIKVQELQRPYASAESKIGAYTSLPAEGMHSLNAATANVEEMMQHHQQLSAPGHLNPGYASTDTDSQVFVTPLTSAGFRSPNVPMEQRTLTYELDHADDSDDSDFEDHADHHQGPEHYRLEEEQTMTVHGEDNLFDYSDNSVRSPGGDSGSSHRGEEDAPSHANDLEHLHSPSVDSPSVMVPALPTEKPALADSADIKNQWADEVESDLEEESNPPTTLATPPTRAAQTPATEMDITPLEMAQETPPSASRGLAASRHNPQRPQTPVEEHVEEVFDAENFMPRDVTNVSWHERSDSAPQSLHSQSTLDSSPSSPEQVHSHDTRDPVIRYSWQTGSTGQFTSRVRGDSVMTDSSGQFGRYDSPINRKESPPPPLPQWHHESVDTAAPAPSQWGISDPLDDISEDNHDTPAQPTSPPSTGTGSLFQRMRSVFEQAPSSSNTTNRLSTPSLPTSSLSGKGNPVRSRPLSGPPRPTASARTGMYDADDDDSDEHSSLLASGDRHNTRLSA